MRTRVLTPGPDLEHDPAVAEAAALLRTGGLAAFPTETVYGLGADATNREAVEEIFYVKGRPADNPVIVHIADLAMLETVAASGDPRVARLAASFWPGPLTLVLPAKEAVRPACRGLDTVGVRMPDHPVALALLRAAGVPVAAPSANRSGRPSPTTAQHVLDDLGGRIPLILDGGPCRIGIESTVLDLSTPALQVLRPGHVSAEAIAETLGAPLSPATEEALWRSPGTHHPHYRPQAPVIVLGPGLSDAVVARLIARLIALLDGRLGYVATGTRNPVRAPSLEIIHTGQGLASGLYASLRELDLRGVAAILVEAPPHGEAVWDRLRRAAWRVITTDAEADSFDLG